MRRRANDSDMDSSSTNFLNIGNDDYSSPSPDLGSSDWSSSSDSSSDSGSSDFGGGSGDGGGASGDW